MASYKNCWKIDFIFEGAVQIVRDNRVNEDKLINMSLEIGHFTLSTETYKVFV